MTSRIHLRPAAVQALTKIDPANQRRIQGAITILATTPHPPAATPLTGRPAWHIRVGDYRIIYTITDQTLLIVSITPGHRPDITTTYAPARPDPIWSSAG